jgi:hypothetical protein
MEELKKGIPVEERAGLEKTVAKAGGGSLKARVKLMCLDCCNWEKGEVAHCEIKTCPLWDVRPYKRTKMIEKVSVIDGETLVEQGTNERIGLVVL